MDSEEGSKDLSKTKISLYAAAQASIMPMRARGGEYIGCRHDHMSFLSDFGARRRRLCVVVRPPAGRAGVESVRSGPPGRARAVARGRRVRKNIFWGGFVRTPARAGKYFFKLSVVRFGGRTHGRRRTLFSFARPAGKLNFGFIQLVLPEQKQSRSLDFGRNDDYRGANTEARTKVGIVQR